MEPREFLDLFTSEAREHLEGTGALLLRARQETLPREAIDDLFRHAHSLKGMAASMGFRPITELSHAMEDLLHAWRDGGEPPTPEILDLLLRAADRLATQVDGVAAGGVVPDATDLAGALRAHRPAAGGAGGAGHPAMDARAPGAAPPAAPRPGAARGRPGGPPSPAGGPGDDPERDPRPRLRLEVILRPSTPLPAARALVVLRWLGGHGQVVLCAPDPTAVVSGGFSGRFEVTLATQAEPERLARLVAGLPDVLECRPVAHEERRRQGRRGAGERRAGLGGDAEPGGEAAEVARPEMINTIRVATERMDRLLDGIGELILDRERLKEALRPEPGSPPANLLEVLGRTVDAVRDEVMTMRLIPFASIVPRLQRTVRDLAQRLGKAVDLVVEGTDVSLDRSILEEMLDPLQHILRNSIDHGIEDAEGRRAAGKPPAGRIAIGLSPREDWVRLVVSDDGRGIDPAALRRVALERRFIQREAAEAMSDDEALMLITIPGFSTAARTTDISGRGVGMDVVRTRVQSLGGRLTIDSRLGTGTRFEMDLPLTVAVTRAFLCRSAGEVYAVPVAAVQSTLEIRSAGLLGSQGRQMLRHADQVVSVIPLGGVLSGQPPAEFAAAFPALLYQVGRQSYALAVDEILGESEIVVKPLKHPLELLPHYAGAAILNDGRIALILDPASLTRASRAV